MLRKLRSNFYTFLYFKKKCTLQLLLFTNFSFLVVYYEMVIYSINLESYRSNVNLLKFIMCKKTVQMHFILKDLVSLNTGIFVLRNFFTGNLGK